MDYEFRKVNRKCHATGNPIKPGDEFVSAIVSEGNQINRYDYSVAGWADPPPNTIGFWKSSLPKLNSTGNRMAPPEVIVELFMQLETDKNKLDLRFVLGLLMLRRKLLRIDSVDSNEKREVWNCICAISEQETKLLVREIPNKKVNQLQNQIVELLFGTAHESEEPADLATIKSE